MGWFQSFFRSGNQAEKPAWRRGSSGPIACLKPDSGELPPSTKTPSSDRLPKVHVDAVGDALRRAMFADPTLMYAKLSSDDAEAFLIDLFEDLEVKPGDLRIHRVRAGNFPCIIVEMPTPQSAGPAYFAGLLVTVSARVMPITLTPSHVRYFTLEKRSDEPHDPATVLCEWTARGDRRSFGSGPAPRVDRFLFALSGMAR